MDDLKVFDAPIHVTKSFMPPMQEYISEIERLWNNSWITNNGVIHQEFEQGLKRYLDVDNVSLFVNGHMALEIAIKSLDLKGEVITTPFTFASTTHAIINNKLKPVFCDINRDNYNIDVTLIEPLITENTSAIIPVHVFGTPCDIHQINVLARKYNLKVIYDAAHAFGVRVNNNSIAKYGDFSMFSLHATKMFHSIEGGVLTYPESESERKVELLKNFGISGPESVEMPGVNAKMNEFQAAMGNVNLKYVNQLKSLRKQITECYDDQLRDIPGIKILERFENIDYNYSYYPILVDESVYGYTRDDLHLMLTECNVITRKYFYPLITDFNCYKEQFSHSITPNAKYVSERILTLPIYPDLSLESVAGICENIRRIYNRGQL